VGVSFGGLVATHVAAHSPWLAALALRCPVADFPELLRLQFGERAIEIWRLFGLVVDLRRGTPLIPVDYGFYEDCCRYDSYEAAARIHVPTIVVHGECDELVPQHQIYRLHDAIAADKELHMITGANRAISEPPMATYTCLPHEACHIVVSKLHCVNAHSEKTECAVRLDVENKVCRLLLPERRQALAIRCPLDVVLAREQPGQGNEVKAPQSTTTAVASF
jgi:dienelactone hydrolase